MPKLRPLVVLCAAIALVIACSDDRAEPDTGPASMPEAAAVSPSDASDGPGETTGFGHPGPAPGEGPGANVEAELARRRAEAERRPEPRTVDAIQEGLDDSDPEVRARAVRFLDTEGAEFELLQEALTDDPAPQVRAEAASQISMADEPIALATLVPALQDPDPEVILAVIEALEFVGEPDAIPHLEPFLQHKNEEIREEAQDAIEFLEP